MYPTETTVYHFYADGYEETFTDLTEARNWVHSLQLAKGTEVQIHKGTRYQKSATSGGCDEYRSGKPSKIVYV